MRPKHIARYGGPPTEFRSMAVSSESAEAVICLNRHECIGRCELLGIQLVFLSALLLQRAKRSRVAANKFGGGNRS